MPSFFFYGRLCHAPLLEAVLGHPLATEPAVLPDHAVYQVQGEAFAMIVEAPGASAQGCIAHDLSVEDIERLSYYEAGFGYHRRQVAAAGAVVQLWYPDAGRWHPDVAWDQEAWLARAADVAFEAARDMMMFWRERPVDLLARRRSMIEVRAASRLRARKSGAEATLLDTRAKTPSAADVDVVARREPYANFFAVEEFDVSYRHYDGGASDVVNRGVFVTGDAATVLPYDPVRDCVMLIEQFRIGPFARGDGEPWLLEPIAGRVDAHETPEDAVRREAGEEAGVTLGALHLVGNYYPTPAAKSEYLYSYVAVADLPESSEGFGGLEDEAEDIRVHLIGFDALMALVEGARLTNGPLLLSAYWLARHRDRLRAGA